MSATSDEPVLTALDGDGTNFAIVGYKLGPGYRPQQGPSTVTAGAGCSADSNGGFGGVKCPAAGVDAVAIQLGAGGDSLQLANLGVDVPMTADTGGGPDLISIGPTDGFSSSSVTGPLAVNGGEGDDIYRFTPDGVHPRSLSGGPGRDSIVVAPKSVPTGPDSQYSTFEGTQVSLDDQPNDGNLSNAHDNVRSDIEDLYGTSASDNLSGSSANNAIYGGGGSDTVDGGDGDDVIRDIGPSSPLPGSMPDETVVAQGGRFMGGAGNDDIDASGTVDGGPGNDHLIVAGVAHGGEGDDTLTARPGETSALLGEAGDDKLVGSDGTTFMIGGTGRDEQLGGPGRDEFIDDAPPGPDSISGGGGEDSLFYLQRARGVTVRLSRATGNGEPGENDTVTGVEDVAGTEHADHLVGDGGPNVLTGGPGADTIEGLAGDDRVENERPHFDAKCLESVQLDQCFDETEGSGPAADDRFFGGPGQDRLTDNDRGADTLAGGGGNDTIDAERGGSDRVSGGAGDDDIDVFQSGTRKHPSHVAGGTGDDYIRVGVTRPVVVNCGPGFDIAENATLFSDLGSTCEFARHVFTTDVSAQPYDLSRRSVSVPMHCAKLGKKSPRCQGVLTLRSSRPGHALLGHAAYRFPAGGELQVRVPLDVPKVRAALPRGRGKVRVDTLEGPSARNLRPQQPFAAAARR